MRLLGFLFKLLFLALLIGPIALVAMSVQEQPLIAVDDNRLIEDDVRRVKEILRNNDPRKLGAGQVRSVSLAEQDINLLVNHALSYLGKVNTMTQLRSGEMQTQMTIELPDNPIGRYINLSAGFSQASDALSLENFSLGSTELSGDLLNPLIDWTYDALLQVEEVRPILEAANGFQLLDGRATMLVQADPRMFDQLKAAGRAIMFPESDQRRIMAYTDGLVRVMAAQRAKRMNLEDVLPPLFRLARERTATGQDPRLENRALFQALGFYMSGTDLNRLMAVDGSSDIRFRRPRRVTLYLMERADLAQHFIVSSVLAVSAGSQVADAVGFFKEVSDSQGGSGFSFADLAADRAGVVMAEMGTAQRAGANALQMRMMSGSVQVTDFMPRIDRLPEGMQESEMRRRYGGADGSQSRRVQQEIERRLKRCKVYRGYI